MDTLVTIIHNQRRDFLWQALKAAATYEEDRAGLVLAREGLLNVDHLMWGSDYPHTEGTFPYSQEQIAKDLAGIPAAQAYKLVAGNAADLYGLA
jgi:predicted TIM-barrel fold metal-dependent hydrolase